MFVDDRRRPDRIFADKNSGYFLRLSVIPRLDLGISFHQLSG
jgi:hypothetical protein